MKGRIQMAKCSKCKEEKQPLYKRCGARLCQDCLPPWHGNSNKTTMKRERTAMDDLQELASKIEKAKLKKPRIMFVEQEDLHWGEKHGD